MRRDSQGLRDLKRYLDEIKDLDDQAFADATGGADRAETLELLTRLDALIAGVDEVAAKLHPDVN
jgi:hypothetical protein